ncbi:MAG: aminoacyl-tRNA hydrolase [Pseudomonadota bacterium]
MATARPDFKLVVGLGNPGAEYEETRHNVGFWLADRLAGRYAARFAKDVKAHGDVARIQTGAFDARILKPGTFMNRSGQAVAALSSYFKIAPEQILVAHDELDLPPGTVKIKHAGGHGGHNGLRDISKAIGTQYWRVRIGIGHPGHRDRVSPWVLSRAGAADERAVNEAIERVIEAADGVLFGDFARATQRINTLPAPPPRGNET